MCKQCGHEEPKWLGRCPGCGEWNSFKEMRVSPGGTLAGGRSGSRGSSGSLAGAGGYISRSRRGDSHAPSSDAPGVHQEGQGIHEPVSLAAVQKPAQARLASGIGELDRVLGGGLMEGSSVLIGGEPGIGKSTLMLQAAGAFQHAGQVLYVSGEEGAQQLKLRAERLGITNTAALLLFCNPQIEYIQDVLNQVQPRIIIIDSIQTLITQDIDSAPGTVNQMKLSVFALSEWARSHQAGVFFIAHVTKEGSIAGPKVIEHMVDAVILFEHSGSDIRFLRAQKNRFGSVDEVGLFTMGDQGLEELSDPSKVFLVERDTPLPPGVVAAPIFEGSRILVVEIQALTVPVQAGYGRVYSDKIDARRVSRIAAVLEKHAGIRLSDQDIYVNVSGGIRIQEVGVELPLALAIMSARTGQALSRQLAVAGEVSLAGELRPVSHYKQRVSAAKDLGFIHSIDPGAAKKVKTIQEAVKQALSIKKE